MRLRLTVLLACIVSILAIPGPGGLSAAGAQSGEGSLVIYSYACPEGFSGTDFASCRDTPLQDVGFHAFAAGQDNGIGGASSADGDAHFPLSALGGGAVNVIVNPPPGYESIGVACSQQHGAIDGGITLAEVATDAFVTCEWYFAVASDPPAGPPPPVQRDDPDGTAPVTTLPDTGSGPVERETGPTAWTAPLLGLLAIVVLFTAHIRRRRA